MRYLLFCALLISCDSPRLISNQDSALQVDATITDDSSLNQDIIALDSSIPDQSIKSHCMYPTDCILRPASCCGDCGAYTRDDIISLTLEDLDDYLRENCSGGEFSCPGCYKAPNPSLFANCSEDSQCTWIDIYDPDHDYATEYTRCSTDSDCVLRTRECCECGATISQDNIVAIRKDKLSDFEKLVCKPETGCPECAADYFPFFTWCGGEDPNTPKRCHVDILGP